jgi:hypothetical protein
LVLLGEEEEELVEIMFVSLVIIVNENVISTRTQ